MQERGQKLAFRDEMDDGWTTCRGLEPEMGG